MKHPYNVKKLAKEDSKKVLSKAKIRKANQTETGKPADAIEVDPVKQGMQNQSLNN